MILPIGHEESGVRRLPWVSFAIMAICIATLVLVNPSSAEMDQGAEELWRVLEYYLEHPYLEVDPMIEEMLGGSHGAYGADSFLEAAKQAINPPSDPEVLRAEQAELDELTRRALDGLGVSFYHRWGLVPANPSAVAFVTHMFLHAGWLHLLGNLLIFYLAGPFLEDVWGRPVFAAFYLMAGLFAALSQMLRFSDSAVPLVGASGAIAGVMGAFLIRYWHTRIRFFYMFGLIIRGTFDAPAWIMLPLWFGQQVFFALLTDPLSSGGGVAYWAHMGGFAFGAAVGYGMRHFQVEERYLRSALESKVTTSVVDNTEVERALESHARGGSEEALKSLARAVEGEPGNADAVLAFWTVAVECGQSDRAAGAMAHLVGCELRAGQSDLAVGHWSDLTARVANPPANADVLVRLSQALAGEGRRGEAAVVLRRALLEAGSGMTSGMALRIARAAKELDPQIACGAARLILDRSDLDPSERSHAEKILSDIAGPRLSEPF